MNAESKVRSAAGRRLTPNRRPATGDRERESPNEAKLSDARYERSLERVVRHGGWK